MEMAKQNFLNTTTAVTVDTNIAAIPNLFNPDRVFQYVSSNYDGNTVTTITVSFDSTLTVSRISLVEHNLKVFDIWYDGSSANTFAITTTGDTSTISYSSNSETSHYWKVAPQACTSVSFALGEAMLPNTEKAISFMYIGQEYFVFDRPPPSKGYKPLLEPKKIVHKLSDGGTRIHELNNKWRVELGLENIDVAWRDNLKAVFDTKAPFMFIPFGTTTSWDTLIFEAVWENGFEFYTHSNDAVSVGLKGKIKLRETTT